jgi:putative membrane protein
MIHLIVVWLVTAVSLLIITKLPLGVEVDDFGTALIAAVVLGILNAVLKPVLALIALPITILTLGLFAFVINALVFALAAWLIKGFRVKSVLSALIGPIVLSILNALIFWILPG